VATLKHVNRAVSAGIMLAASVALVSLTVGSFITTVIIVFTGHQRSLLC